MKYIDFEAPYDTHKQDVFFMQEALKEAQKALAIGEIPVGAVVVCKGKIIGKGHNLTQRLNDVTAHAEMQAFTAAADAMGGKYLSECTLYVTLEPCVMCAGASYWTQIGRIVFGAKDEKRGFLKINSPILHPKTILQDGVLAQECSDILQHFFQKLRE